MTMVYIASTTPLFLLSLRLGQNVRKWSHRWYHMIASWKLISFTLRTALPVWNFWNPFWREHSNLYRLNVCFEEGKPTSELWRSWSLYQKARATCLSYLPGRGLTLITQDVILFRSRPLHSGAVIIKKWSADYLHGIIFVRGWKRLRSTWMLNRMEQNTHGYK